MASQVPYSGTLDVAPQLDPLSNVHVDTPVAAFGGAVADAITHLGQTAEGAGKEIFNQAYQTQALNEQVKADAASADAADKMTVRYLDFDKLKGQERMDALPKYMQDINQIRQDGGKDLSPYASAKYLGDSRRLQSQMVWHGGVAARQGMDQSVSETGKLWRDKLGDQLSMADPTTPAFGQTLGQIRQSAVQEAESLHGFTPGSPESQQFADSAISEQAAKVVIAANRADPAKAKQLLDQFNDKGLLRPSDSAKLAGPVDAGVETKAARHVAHMVASGNPTHWGDENYTDNVTLEGLKAAGTGSYNSAGKPLPDGSYSVGKYGVNSALLAEKLPSAGLTNESGNPVKTEADFRNSPQAQDAFAKAQFSQGGKTFKEAFKTWTGEDNPQRLGAALQAVAKSADPKMVRDKARSAMADAAPNNDLAQDNAAEIAAQNQERSQRIDQIAEQGTRSDVISMINGDNTLDGRVPQSLDEALKNPKFAEKYNDLGDKDRNAVIDILHKNSDLGGVRENSVGYNEYNRLKSIMLNRDTTSNPKEIEEAAQANLLTLPVSPQHRSELMQLQHKILQGQVANPDYNYGMRLPEVQKLMSDVGIDKKTNEPAYNRFVTAYADALAGFGQGQDKPVKKIDDYVTVAKGLISQHANTWSGYFQGEKQPYADFMGTGAKVHKQGMDLFYKTVGRSMDPESQDDKDLANKLLTRAVFHDMAHQPTSARTGSGGQ